VTAEDLARWIEGYERAWRSPGTDALAELFAPEATYSPGPYEQTIVGLDALAALWERQRVSADERFAMSWESVAIDGDVAVVRVEVRYEDPVEQEYRDLWIVRLGADGRCVAFEEWPFWPGQPLSAGSV
jgi:SnoaL-like domain